MTATAIIAGYLADVAVGDPRQFHPVAGFGRVAARVERAIYAPSRVRGAVHVAILVGLTAYAAERASRTFGRPAVLAVLTWAALGGRNLTHEARTIGRLVARGELEAARREVPKLVGRDALDLDAEGVTRAVVESVAENTSDAVVGAVLWGAFAGPAGVAGFRAANTLDAMIGHRDARYERFGWAAARLDDALCWPASRLGALLTALCAPIIGGDLRSAWRTLRSDGGAHPSPNAGRMEAAFAGALGVRLGGPVSYAGRPELRPSLGRGRCPTPNDVDRAAALSNVVAFAATVICAALRWAITNRRKR